MLSSSPSNTYIGTDDHDVEIIFLLPHDGIVSHVHCTIAVNWSGATKLAKTALNSGPGKNVGSVESVKYPEVPGLSTLA